MHRCKNPTPADEAMACCTKLAELEQVREQLLEEECEAAAVAEACEHEVVARCEHEAAARREHEVAERRRWEAAERREREVAETRDRGHQQDRCLCLEAGGSQVWQWSASPGVSQSGGPVQSSWCVNLSFVFKSTEGLENINGYYP